MSKKLCISCAVKDINNLQTAEKGKKIFLAQDAYQNDNQEMFRNISHYQT